MAVYVDNYRGKFRGMVMSHMMADSRDELHAFAALIGMRREWFQDKSAPHYDVCQQMRAMAIKAGAVPIDIRSQQWREVYQAAKESRNHKVSEVRG